MEKEKLERKKQKLIQKRNEIEPNLNVELTHIYNKYHEERDKDRNSRATRELKNITDALEERKKDLEKEIDKLRK